MRSLPEDELDALVLGQEGRSVSAETYERFAVCEEGHGWELHRGRLREKPPRSFGHGHAARTLTYRLVAQLDQEDYVVSPGVGRVARGDMSYLIPDLHVIPAALLETLRRTPYALDAQRESLPFIVEIWCPLAGAYDIDEKIPEYIARGDVEIWRLDPFSRHLNAWRRRPDGGYDEVEFTGGIVELHALPGVRIDLDALFVSDE